MTGLQQISFDILNSLDNHYEKYIIFGAVSEGVGCEVDLKEIEV
jgi:hypothetical protein